MSSTLTQTASLTKPKLFISVVGNDEGRSGKSDFFPSTSLEPAWSMSISLSSLSDHLSSSLRHWPSASASRDEESQAYLADICRGINALRGHQFEDTDALRELQARAGFSSKHTCCKGLLQDRIAVSKEVEGLLWRHGVDPDVMSKDYKGLPNDDSGFYGETSCGMRPITASLDRILPIALGPDLGSTLDNSASRSDLLGHNGRSADTGARVYEKAAGTLRVCSNGHRTFTTRDGVSQCWDSSVSPDGGHEWAGVPRTLLDTLQAKHTDLSTEAVRLYESLQDGCAAKKPWKFTAEEWRRNCLTIAAEGLRARDILPPAGFMPGGASLSADEETSILLDRAAYTNMLIDRAVTVQQA